MPDRRTIAALVITALTFFNVVLIALVAMFWQQHRITTRELNQTRSDLETSKLKSESISRQRDELESKALINRQDLDRMSKKLDRLTRDFVKTSYPNQTNLYKEMVNCNDPGKLHQFMLNDDDTIATQAAWKLVKLTVAEKTAPNELYPVGKDELERFLNFFEVRNRIAAPEWWRIELQVCKANSRDSIFSGDMMDGRSNRLRNQKWSSEFSLSKSDGRFVIGSGSEKCILPRKNLVHDGKLNENLRVVWLNDRCIMTLSNGIGFSHAVWAVERNSGKILWESDACGYATWSATTGPHESWLTLETTTDGRIFVFGAGTHGYYSHAFDTKNGRTLMYFSSNF